MDLAYSPNGLEHQFIVQTIPVQLPDFIRIPD